MGRARALTRAVTGTVQGYAQTICDMKVGIVETAGNDPKKWVSLFKSAGCICIHKAVTIRHALSAERIGVDIIRCVARCAVETSCAVSSRCGCCAREDCTRRMGGTLRANGTDGPAAITSVDAFECAGHPGEADVGGMVLFAKAAKKLTKPWSVPPVDCARARSL